jgi:hypothetical protein
MAITHAPLVSAIIIPKSFFSFPLPHLFDFHNPYSRAASFSTGRDCSASNSLETVTVPIHIPLRLYKPSPRSFFSLVPFLQPLATAPIQPSFSRNDFFLCFRRHFLRVRIHSRSNSRIRPNCRLRGLRFSALGCRGVGLLDLVRR